MLEGLDGAGTTTQAAELGRRLRARGLTVLVTAEPSRGPIGSLIRTVLGKRLVGPAGRPFDRGALALLFAADRLDHVASEIVPTLASGGWVISDRYFVSSLAYQTLDLPEPFVRQINERAPRPDLTLFLDVPAEAALRRRRAEGAAPELFEDLALQRRVALGYRRALTEGGGGSPVAVVDGTASIAAVSDAVEAAILERFFSARPASERRAAERRPGRSVGAAGRSKVARVARTR